jgi:hypothetical protein
MQIRSIVMRYQGTTLRVEGRLRGFREGCKSSFQRRTSAKIAIADQRVFFITAAAERAAIAVS